MEEVKSEPALIRHFKGHSGKITQLAFHPSDIKIASSSSDKSVMLWDFDQAVRCIKFNAHKDSVNSVAWSSNGDLLASGSNDRIVRLWVPKIKGGTNEFLAHNGAIRSVDFNNINSKYLITASDDKSIKLWDITLTNKSSKFITSFIGHTNWIRDARFNPINEDLIASCGDDKHLRIHDIKSGSSCIHMFPEEKGLGRKVAWHPDGNIVAIALTNNRIKIYDIRAKKLIQLYHIHSECVNSISFHPSGNYLLSGSDDKTMKILDLLEGRPIYTLTGHFGKVTAVTFSHDGNYFATGGQDKQLMIWRTNFVNYDSSSCRNSSSSERLSSESGSSIGITPLSPQRHNSSHLKNKRDEILTEDQSIIIDAKSSDLYDNEQDYQVIPINLLTDSGDSNNQKFEIHIIPSKTKSKNLINNTEILMWNKNNDIKSIHDEINEKFQEIFTQITKMSDLIEHFDNRLKNIEKEISIQQK